MKTSRAIALASLAAASMASSAARADDGATVGAEPLRPPDEAPLAQEPETPTAPSNAPPPLQVAPPSIEPAPLSPVDAKTESRWYGWQTLAVDGAAAATIVLPPLGIATYLLGPPIVHWAHGRVGVGFADVGIRLAAPVLLTLAGAALSSGGNPEDIAPGAIVGFFLGYSGAVAVDAAVLAREEVKREPSQAYSLQLLPIRGVDGRMKLTGAGLAGRF